MQSLLTSLVFILAVAMILSEVYKISFERKSESKDERGAFILLKVKNVSYYILLGGIILGVILVRTFEVLSQINFFYFIMIVFFVQSIVSAMYLYRLKRI